jgi:hypothetical protein
LRIGFPHSEIRGSKGARPSSRLIAACYVLHRLCAPRHPPDALALTLDRSAFRSMPRKKASEDCSSRANRPEFGFNSIAISLGVFRVNRSCKPANPAFTMSEILRRHRNAQARVDGLRSCCCFPPFGHAASISAGLRSRSSRQAARLALWATAWQPCPLRERRLVEPIGIEPTT